MGGPAKQRDEWIMQALCAQTHTLADTVITHIFTNNTSGVPSVYLSGCMCVCAWDRLREFMRRVHCWVHIFPKGHSDVSECVTMEIKGFQFSGWVAGRSTEEYLHWIFMTVIQCRATCLSDFVKHQCDITTADWLYPHRPGTVGFWRSGVLFWIDTFL